MSDVFGIKLRCSNCGHHFWTQDALWILGTDETIGLEIQPFGRTFTDEERAQRRVPDGREVEGYYQECPNCGYVAFDSDQSEELFADIPNQWASGGRAHSQESRDIPSPSLMTAGELPMPNEHVPQGKELEFTCSERNHRFTSGDYDPIINGDDGGFMSNCEKCTGLSFNSESAKRAWRELEFGPRPESESQSLALPKRMSPFKIVTAIVIAMACGIVLRPTCVLVLYNVLPPQDGLPRAVAVTLELACAVVAGTIAGVLTANRGWLYGSLTQILKIGFLVFVIGLSLMLPLVSTKPSPLGPIWEVQGIGLAISAILAGALGGVVAQRYRWLLSHTLGLVAVGSFAGAGCVLNLIALVVELYFAFLAGKALFIDHNVGQAFLLACIIGPVVSYLMAAAILVFFVVLSRAAITLHNWYAPDLGLEFID